MTTSSIGDRIRAFRLERGLTQEALARRAGSLSQNIYRYETGRMVPGSDALRRLAEALDVSVDFLLTGHEHQQEHDGQ